VFHKKRQKKFNGFFLSLPDKAIRVLTGPAIGRIFS
jgi:hypothetical protein